MQIEADISTDRYISGRFTLWDQGGSRVLRGHLLVLPMEQTLLYVKPIYLEATQTQIPELKMVVTAHGTTPKPQFGDTLAESLAKDFGDAVYALLAGKIQTVPKARSPSPITGTDLASLADQAKSLYERAQASGRKGDWKSFGEDMKELGAVLQTIRKAARSGRSEQRAALP
jgi:hypothetical protein